MLLRLLFQFFPFVGVFIPAIVVFAFFGLPYTAQAFQPTASVANAGPGFLQLEPEKEKTISFQFLNTGDSSWSPWSDSPIRFRFRNYGNLFIHNSWVLPHIPTRQEEYSVQPGEIATFIVTMRSPSAVGSYIIEPYLILGDQEVQHDSIQLVAEISPSSSVLSRVEARRLALARARGETISVPPSPSTQPDSNGTVAGVQTATPLFEEEPIIRVGLFVVEEPVVLTADTTFTLTSNDKLLETLGAGTQLTLEATGTQFTYTLPNGTTATTAHPLKVASEGGVLEVPSFEQIVAWKPSLNDNRYRGTLELYYADTSGRFWLVNELPMEQYLKGLAETSQGAPPEYHKALATATRTYAMYHWIAKYKHGGHFDVDATYDQVYRGYNLELRGTDFAAALDATRGMVVTVNNEIVVTPYYSQSDGRTRSWAEVWGGSRAHLVSVPVPWDSGESMLGHGVGMSSMGAARMADQEGSTWQEILKYFYTGIDIQKGYE